MAIDPKTGREHYLDREDRNIIKHGDPLPPHMREVIGNRVQLRLPLVSGPALRDVAARMQIAVDELKALSYARHPEYTVLLGEKVIIRSLQASLDTIYRQNRKSAIKTVG
ncbi:MAG: hypothetical protein DI532_21900 [Azospirillum brasilense]|nr:MAG: hypothetical protein DI532_21900 [Azospirillum brasilense]